jgi:hypothetical protein
MTCVHHLSPLLPLSGHLIVTPPVNHVGPTKRTCHVLHKLSQLTRSRLLQSKLIPLNLRDLDMRYGEEVLTQWLLLLLAIWDFMTPRVWSSTSKLTNPRYAMYRDVRSHDCPSSLINGPDHIVIS